MSSRQITEWQLYFEEFPFGQDISDMMLAKVAAMLANRWRKNGTEAFTPQQMLPNFKRQSPEEMKFALRRFIQRGHS